MNVRGADFCVVPSSVLFCAQYFPTQNHLTICKPKTTKDENYAAVRNFIQACVERSEEDTKQHA
jgi:hypothetical protein